MQPRGPIEGKSASPPHSRQEDGTSASEETEQTSENKIVPGIFNKSQNSREARRSFGGIYAELSAHSDVPVAILKKLRRAFSLLSKRGVGKPGPRYKWSRFCTRLKSYRDPRVARREELGTPAILVLPDVSGSCSGFADQSLLFSNAAATLGVSGVDVIVVEHNNGYPVATTVNGKKLKNYENFWSVSREATLKVYSDIISCYDVQCVVACGDFDASWLYYKLAKSLSIVWLDNYACNYGKPQFMPSEIDSRYKNIVYIHRCSDAVDFVTALEMAIKKL